MALGFGDAESPMEKISRRATEAKPRKILDTNGTNGEGRRSAASLPVGVAGYPGWRSSDELTPGYYLAALSGRTHGCQIGLPTRYRRQPTQGTGAKAKGRSGGFSNFGGLVQPRMEMTLRCAPVISILCRLGIMVIVICKSNNMRGATQQV